MSVTSQQVVSLLENVLFESQTQAAANAASWQANPAATSVSNLAAAMAASSEAGIPARIVGFYLTALGRAPSPAELRFYISFAEMGVPREQIAAGQLPNGIWSTISGFFTQSPEFAARAGLDFSLGATGALFEAVPWLYHSVLGRTPTAGEISFYDNAVLSGASLNQLFLDFTGSREFHTDTGDQIAAALSAYGAAIASGQQPPATIGASVALGPPPPALPAPPSIPVTLALTGATDTLTAANASQTFTAILGGAAPTLTANDTLHGTGTGNTLQITDTSGAASQDLMPSGVTLTTIPTLTLTTSGNAGTDAVHPFDLSGFASLTSVTVTASGTQGDYLKLGSGAALALQTPSATVSVNGFASMALTDNHLATLDLSGTGGAITLTDSTGPAALTVNASALTLAGAISDASNHIASLTIDGGAGAASFIDYAPHSGGYSITGSALSSLTVTGNVWFGSPADTVTLPSGLTHFDSTGDADWVYLAYAGSGATFAFGASQAYLVDDSGNTVTGTGVTDIFCGGTGTGESISLGNANCYIALHDGGSDTVSLGNGTNTVAISQTGHGNAITFGGGNNTVTDTGTGTNSVTFGNGNNSFTSNSEHNTVIFGTGYNTADLGNITTDLVKVGTDAGYGSSATTPNLVVRSVGAGDTIALTSIVTIAIEYMPGTPGQGGSAAGTVTNLESAISTGNPGVSAIAVDQYHGDTFIVASASGSTLGAADTTIIQLVGYTGFVSWNGTDNVLHLG